jgi:hypothetical protein
MPRYSLTADQWARIRAYLQVRHRSDLERQTMQKLGYTLAAVADGDGRPTRYQRRQRLETHLVLEALKYAIQDTHTTTGDH